MSSLVTSASNWISSEPPKRRPSTMRKTIKKKPLQEDSMTEPNYNKLKPSTFEDMQNLSTERTSRVNDLLNEISTTTIDESNQLADFEPLGPPDIQSKRDIDNSENSHEYNPSISTYLDATINQKHKNKNDINYGANDSSHQKLSNYSNSYDPPKAQPYYAKMGLSAKNDTGDGNNKLMERVNYMIHLLEAQQHEKTDNITEEFILYTFLGVFVIFVVDSFAKTGKYTR